MTTQTSPNPAARARFGRTGVEVPRISLGTWGHGGLNTNKSGFSVGWQGGDDDLARQALVAAYEAGVTHWDTADVYGEGHAEVLIGSVWDRVPRGQIFLATKVGWDPGGAGHYYEPARMRANMERSLRNLRTDAVDLLYLHHCDFGEGDRYFEGALDTVRRFQREGKARFIGLSDWKAERIMRFIDRVDPDVVQPYRNVQDDDYERSGLRAWIDGHDAGVAFFSPLKHGLLLGKYEAPTRFPEGDFRRNVAGFEDAAVIARMRRARAAIERRFAGRPEPMLHALLGALLSGNPTATVLVGMRNPAQVRSAAAAGEALSEEDARFVRALYAAGSDGAASKEEAT